MFTCWTTSLAMVIHFLEFLVVLWGESSVSAVQEGEGRQETGSLFMKGRDQKEWEAPKSMSLLYANSRERKGKVF